MKLIKIALALFLFIGSSTIAYAQTEGKKKIIVTKKVSDKDGKVVSEKIVLEGEEAEKYIKENKDLKDGLRFVEKEVKIVEGSDSLNEKKVIIKVRENDGEEKVIEWSGDGDLPADIQEKLKENNITVDVTKTDGGDVKVIVNSSDDPVRLGIVSENHVDGVKILSVIDESAAQKAGLKEGDVIYEVGGKTVGSSVQLKAQLEKIEKGGNTDIFFLRNGEKKTAKVDL